MENLEQQHLKSVILLLRRESDLWMTSGRRGRKGQRGPPSSSAARLVMSGSVESSDGKFHSHLCVGFECVTSISSLFGNTF